MDLTKSATESGQNENVNQSGAGAGGSGHETTTGGVSNGEQVGRLAQEVQSKATTAMLTKIVMDKIGKKLPVEDLLHLRETCTLWNDSFLPEIKQHHTPICLRNTNENPTRRNYRLKDFTECMRSSKVIPFTKYDLADPTKDRHAWLDFFGVCAPSVKSLEFDEIKMEVLSKELYELAPQLEELKLDTRAWQPPTGAGGENFHIHMELPKLKKVVISDCDRKDHPLFKELLNELILWAVNLEVLEVDVDMGLPVASTLKNSSRNLGKLRTLKVRPLSVTDLEALVDLSHRKQNTLRLQEFGATICYEHYARMEMDENNETSSPSPSSSSSSSSSTFSSPLESLLAAQAPSLQTLQITIYDYKSIFRIPKMNNVRRLNLDLDSKIEIIYKGGNLASAFPALRIFEWDSPFQPEEMRRNSHDGVTDLKLIGLEGKDCLGMDFVASAVTRLEINMDSANMEEFAQLWGKWPNLQSLHLHLKCYPEWFFRFGHCGSKSCRDYVPNGDELLTGIPEAAFEELKADLGYQGSWESVVVSLDRIQELLRKYKTRPGISDLPHLRSVILHSGCDHNPIAWTDIGGYFGFALANSALQHLWINSVLKVRISSACEGVIREALGPYAFINLSN